MAHRLVPPDGAIVQTEVVGARTGKRHRYTRQSDGAVHVSDPLDVKSLKDMGYREAYGAPALKSKTRTCRECGFNSFFIKCGRCGGDCQEAT